MPSVRMISTPQPQLHWLKRPREMLFNEFVAPGEEKEKSKHVQKRLTLRSNVMSVQLLYTAKSVWETT